MRRMVLILILLLVGPALAQEDDKGFLTGLLERSLSGAGREVTITGFAGALSSRATIEEMTIADRDGVWLVLRGAVLDWNRAALLRGRVEVNTLSAEEIIVSRPPVPPEGITPPPAAAPGFSVPDLPVAIRIGSLRAARVTLGAPVLGQAAQLRLDASAELDGGAADMRAELVRTDGPEGHITFEGGFSNETGILRLDLSVIEGPGGLIAAMTGLPGAPPLALSIAGTGPLNDYSADLALATDGQERLSGQVVLGANDAGAQTFRADLGGDIAALVAPAYRAFFGTDIRLELAGVKEPDGRLDIARLRLETAALRLGGQVGIAAGGLPDRLDLSGTVASAGGGAVLLPIAGPPTRLVGAEFRITLGQSETPEALALNARLRGLERPDLAIADLTLTGDGSVAQAAGTVALDLRFAALGIAPAAPELARAIGPEVTGTARVDWRRGAPLRLPRVRLDGEGYGLTLSQVELGGLDTAGRLSGQVEGRLDDLSQFAGLAGRPLSGAAALDLGGSYAALSGEGTVDLVLNGSDLGLGQPEADALLGGASRIALAAVRDQTGTTLRNLDVEARTLRLTASGALTPGAGDLTARMEFSDLSDLGPGYGGALSASARITGTAPGVQDVAVTARGTGLSIGSPEIDGLLRGETTIDIAATRRGETITLNRLTAGNPALSLEAEGRLAGAASDLSARFSLPDLGVMGPQYRGSLTARARVDGADGAQRIGLTARGDAVALGIAQVDRLLREGLDLRATFLRRDGRLTLQEARVTAASLTASAEGDLTPGAEDVTADLALSRLSDIDTALGGALTAQARITAEGQGRRIDLAGEGRALDLGIAPVDRLLRDGLTLRLSALQQGGAVDLQEAQARAASLDVTARGRIEAGKSTLNADVDFGDLSDLGAGFGGSARAAAQLREDGPLRHLTVTGTSRDIALGVAQASRILRGETSLTLALTEEAGRIEVRQADLANPQITAGAQGSLDGADTAASFTARLADLGLVVPGLNGPLTAEGRLAGTQDGYDIAVGMTGPAGMEARVDGRAAPGFATVDLGMAGSVQAALANPFLTPRLVEGPARFDLRLNGAPALQALSGRISLPDARLVDPATGITLDNIRADVTLGDGRAAIDLGAAVAAGGRIAVSGPVTLTAPFESALKLTLDKVILRDPELYETRLRGAIDITGPLTGGALIAGDIRLNDTEIRVPSTGFGADGALPRLEHVNEPAEVRATRARAGLLHDEDPQAGARRARPYRLDVTIRAPRQIFIRGRGLDAEMGGRLRVTGTTDDIIPIGAFDLIRGRLDILGQRFDLDNGSAQLQGELVPYIDLSATTRTSDIQATIVIAGPATEPKISFQSSPELPEEEVLAQILFRRDLSQISAFQALQLASAVQTLAGRGGGGIVSRLRQGVGLDNLDVITDAEGNTGVQAGKYISPRIYSDVTVDSTGRSEINLNFDVTRSLTARGSVANDGSTGVGMFFERDY